VTPSSNVTLQEQIPQDRIQSISQIVQSLNDTLSEAVTVRVESEQQNNATTWAMVLANLTNTILSKYGNATGAAFDLTDETNLSGIEGEDAQVSGEGINNSAMPENRTTSNVTTSTIIVDEAAYQTAQYLANNTVLQLFNDMLKPFTTTGATGPNGTTAINIDNITTAQQQQQQQQQQLELKCKIDSIHGFSNHSDYNQLIAYISRLKPKLKRVIINHGEKPKVQNLASSVNKILNIQCQYLLVPEATKLL
jgi:hypothetical protein